MGIQTSPETSIFEARKIASLDDAMKHYRIELTSNVRGSVNHGHCPLPTHRRKGGQSFRVKTNAFTGKMIAWECLSKTCIAGRPRHGSDVIALVAAMEKCDLDRAAEMILDGLLSPNVPWS